MLHGPGDSIEKMYFPVTALICLSKEMSNGTALDTALIGRDSMAGLRGLVGPSVHRVYVSASGLAYQVDIRWVRHELDECVGLRQLFWQIADKISRMMVIEAACSHFHTVDQRLAKWIILRHGHPGTMPITATHQSVADAMGIRREAVTNALAKMRGIHVQRGSIEVLDRRALEAIVCECHASLQALRSAPLEAPGLQH